MSRVVLSGYYGFDNLGDEAVLYAIIQSLRREDPDLAITVLSNNPAKTRQLYGVDAVNRWHPVKVWQALHRSDMLISGGGSLLHDVTGPKTIVYYLGVVEMARLLNKPVFFYAQGFGPVRRPFSKALVRLVCNGVDYITLRDEESLADFRSLHVNRPPMEVTADPVLGLDVSRISLQAGRRILQEAGAMTDKPLLGIALRPWQDEETYLNGVAALADQMLRDGWQPVFLPFHHPVDVKTGEKAMARMTEQGAVHLTRPSSVEEMLAVIGNLKGMVGMRLHALIMAAVWNLPIVGISYDPKVERFLAQSGGSPWVRTGQAGPENLLPLVEEKLKTGQTSKEKEALQELKKRATTTAQKALALIRRPQP